MTAHFDLKMTKKERHIVIRKSNLPRSADFTEKLRLAGLRPTRQRLAIAALLLDGRHRHVSADSLTEEITAAGLQVSCGTVYNTLNQFTDAGLLRRVVVHNEYSLFDTNTDHHHHFYEASKDQLVDIPNDDVALSRLPQAPDGHEIKAVDVVIHIQSK
jgi:Fur family iron response transcriptional regulator